MAEVGVVVTCGTLNEMIVPPQLKHPPAPPSRPCRWCRTSTRCTWRGCSRTAACATTRPARASTAQTGSATSRPCRTASSRTCSETASRRRRGPGTTRRRARAKSNLCFYHVLEPALHHFVVFYLSRSLAWPGMAGLDASQWRDCDANTATAHAVSATARGTASTPIVMCAQPRKLGAPG